MKNEQPCHSCRGQWVKSSVLLLTFKRKSSSCILAWSHNLNVLHITATRGGSGGLFIFKSSSSHKRSKDLFPSCPTLTFAWHQGKRNQSVFCTSLPLLQPYPSRQRWFVHMLRQSYSFSLSHYRLLTSEGFPLAETRKKKKTKTRRRERIEEFHRCLNGWWGLSDNLESNCHCQSQRPQHVWFPEL